MPDKVTQQTFADEYARLLYALWVQPHSSPCTPYSVSMRNQYFSDMAPAAFLSAFKSLVPSLSQHMRQQDAHEGLTYVLSLVHDSINR